MTEKTIKTFSDVVATAKTYYEQIRELDVKSQTNHFTVAIYYQEMEKIKSEKTVSLGLVLKLQEQLGQWWEDYNHLLGDASGDSECKRRLREVLGSGKKKGDKP
jgi:hypothetical protein